VVQIQKLARKEAHMRRREFIALFGASVTWPFAAVAQEPGRTYRLGFLYPVRLEPPDAVTAFFDQLRQHGFIEGKNLTIEFRAFAPHPERMSEYAAELVKDGVDVILAGGPAIRAVQEATKTIPILGLENDLEGSGLVNSMARPNGNTTGVSFLATELDGKRQEILIEAVPGLRRLAALADVSNAAAKLDALQEAARAHNVELSIYPIARGEEIAAAIDRAQASGATALNIFSSGILWGNRQLIMDRAAALHLPTMHDLPETAEEGVFAAYGPRLSQLFVEVMPQQIIKLFRGIKVAEIPVEQPTKFELVINLKTAKAMGVTVPPALLLRADKVIE
jgi:putative tryptophan/tyrosine transport system substrate-binding protein